MRLGRACGLVKEQFKNDSVGMTAHMDGQVAGLNRSGIHPH